MTLTTLTELQNKFNLALGNSNSQKFLIENELNEIQTFLNYDPLDKYKNRSLNKFIVKPKSERVFNIVMPNYLRTIFKESFHSYLIYGKFETPKYENDSEENFQYKVLASKQAFEFSEYYKWLNELQSLPQKAIKKSTLTHKQKLLALHYLGLDTSKFDNSKVAKILSEILELSEDNTRQYLSYLSAGKNNVRTKSNLETVIKLYDNQGLTDISNTIKKDLEKL